MTTKQTYLIEGMDCADCVLTLERGVGKLEGVQSVEVNLATTKMVIEGQVTEDVIRQRVEKLGYSLKQAELRDSRKIRKSKFFPGFIKYLFSSRENRLALVGGGLILVGFFLRLVGVPEVWTNPLQIIALALAGFPIARSAINNLLINRGFSINFLMTAAAIGAVIIGEIPEAASLIFLFVIAEALEGYTADRARGSLRDLAALAPARALID